MNTVLSCVCLSYVHFAIVICWLAIWACGTLPMLLMLLVYTVHCAPACYNMHCLLLSYRLCTSCPILAMLKRQRATSFSPLLAHCRMLWVWAVQTVLCVFVAFGHSRPLAGSKDNLWTCTHPCCAHTLPCSSMWSLRRASLLYPLTLHGIPLCLYTCVPCRPPRCWGYPTDITGEV